MPTVLARRPSDRGGLAIAGAIGTEGKDKRFLMGAKRSLFIKKAKRRELLTGG